MSEYCPKCGATTSEDDGRLCANCMNNEPKTIREYIAARKTKIKPMLLDMEADGMYGELVGLEHWLDANEPKAVGEEETPKCCWTEDRNGEAWQAECGGLFTIIDGKPLENGMKFCCFCGKPLAESKIQEDEP